MYSLQVDAFHSGHKNLTTPGTILAGSGQDDAKGGIGHLKPARNPKEAESTSGPWA